MRGSQWRGRSCGTAEIYVETPHADPEPPLSFNVFRVYSAQAGRRVRIRLPPAKSPREMLWLVGGMRYALFLSDKCTVRVVRISSNRVRANCFPRCPLTALCSA